MPIHTDNGEGPRWSAPTLALLLFLNVCMVELDRAATRTTDRYSFEIILAISIPLLGLFISLFGAFYLSTLGIAFPAIMEICEKWPDELGCGKWILVKNILLILIGICGLLAGSYSCISEIERELTKKN